MDHQISWASRLLIHLDHLYFSFSSSFYKVVFRNSTSKWCGKPKSIWRIKCPWMGEKVQDEVGKLENLQGGRTHLCLQTGQQLIEQQQKHPAQFSGRECSGHQKCKSVKISAVQKHQRNISKPVGQGQPPHEAR